MNRCLTWSRCISKEIWWILSVLIMLWLLRTRICKKSSWEDDLKKQIEWPINNSRSYLRGSPPSIGHLSTSMMIWKMSSSRGSNLLKQTVASVEKKSREVSPPLTMQTSNSIHRMIGSEISLSKINHRSLTSKLMEAALKMRKDMKKGCPCFTKVATMEWRE